MNRFHLPLVFLLAFATTFTSFRANAAEPASGIWNAGGTTNLPLSFRDTTDGFHQLKLGDQQTSIQLYKGFAGVLSKHTLSNPTGDTITFKAAIPVNTWFQSNKEDHMTQIHFDSLYKIMVKVDQKQVITTQEHLPHPQLARKKCFWYSWSQTILPGQETKLDIFSIVNTNKAYVGTPYSKDLKNGFIYFLENGPEWAPELNGEIRIEFMEGLNSTNLHGISPAKKFKKNKQGTILQYTFIGKYPTEKDNVCLTYWQEQVGFDFANVEKLAPEVYQNLLTLSQKNFKKSDFDNFDSQSPFVVENGSELGAQGFFKFFTLPILLVAFIIYLIWRIMKRVMRDKMD